MRWDSLLLDSSDARDPAVGSPLPLIERNAVARTFDTPEFRGMTFYEVHAKSIVSEVPKSSRMMFRYTINPYRGCQHSCVYCFARNTHTYLDLDAGRDFDTKVVVKVNAPELLRAKLASPGWAGEHIAMGTNVDCYQRAEGRYRLMRGIIAALRDAANPFSILTKGTLVRRDLDLLLSAAEVTDVGLNVSAAFVDKSLWRAIEPGTPAPERRLEACATLNDAGLSCGVLMGPIVPYLSDSPAQLAAAVRQAAAAGAPTSRRSSCTCGPAPASGSSAGSARRTRNSSPGTPSCTGAARTRARTTRRGSPARSATSLTASASGGTPPDPAASRRGDGAPQGGPSARQPSATSSSRCCSGTSHSDAARVPQHH